MEQPLSFSWTSWNNKGTISPEMDSAFITNLFYYRLFILAVVCAAVIKILHWVIRDTELLRPHCVFQTLNQGTSFHSRMFLKSCVSVVVFHVKVGPGFVSYMIQLILFRLDVHSSFTVLKDFIKTLWKQFTSTIRLFSSHFCDAHSAALLLRGCRFILSRNNYILLYTIQLFLVFRNTCPRPRLSPPLHPQTIFQLVTCIAAYHHPG